MLLPADADPGDLVSAQMRTASFLDDDAATPTRIPPRDTALAQQAFTSILTGAAKEVAVKDVLALKTPEAVRHHVAMLSAYDWDFIEQAKQLRGFVVAKLLDETKHPDARIRLRALELTGKLT